MVLHGLAAKAAGVVVTGITGAAAYDGVKKVLRGPVVRSVAVGATAVGMRAARAVEGGAERVRLTAADIASEARERLGEQTQPPPGGAHDHEH